MIGPERIRLRSPHSRWLGVIDRSKQPYWSTAAPNAPVIPCRSRSRSSVAAVKLPARRVAADRARSRGAELRLALLAEQPQRDRLTVVRSGGIRVLRRQSVVHADHRQAGLTGQALEANILGVALAERPPAAVQVQKGPGGFALRRDDPQRDRATRAVDLDHARLWHVHRRGEDAPALAPSRRDSSGGTVLTERDRRQHPLELHVEGAGLGEEGLGIGRAHRVGRGATVSIRGPLDIPVARWVACRRRSRGRRIVRLANNPAKVAEALGRQLQIGSALRSHSLSCGAGPATWAENACRRGTTVERDLGRRIPTDTVGRRCSTSRRISRGSACAAARISSSYTARTSPRSRSRTSTPAAASRSRSRPRTSSASSCATAGAATASSRTCC